MSNLNYSRNHPFRVKVEWYRKEDKRKGRKSDLTAKGGEAIMNLPCVFCDVRPAGGLHRRDSSLGHTYENSVSCCSECNFIVCDLPERATDHMKPVLRRLRLLGVFDQWKAPTRRQ